MSVAGPLPFSIFVVAFNEAQRIGRTLNSVAGLADEIIVVDSRSTDATRDIARAKGARVIERDWPGYGPQKQFAEEQCRNPWVMNLDADEVATPALIAEIRALFARGEPPLDGYVVKQRDILPGESRAPLFAHALTFVRLYRRDRGRYALSPVHDVVEMAPGARIGRLHAPLDHYGVQSADGHLAKLTRYAQAQADDLAARGVRVPRWRLWVEYPAAFIKAYLLRRYILRGSAGLDVARNYAEYRRRRIEMAIARQDSRRNASQEPRLP